VDYSRDTRIVAGAVSTVAVPPGLVAQSDVSRPYRQLKAPDTLVAGSWRQLGRRVLPVPGSSFDEPGSRAIIDPAEGVDEPVLRIDCLAGDG
jgi:hypothetical protein